jgi:hypothetical protein
MSGQFMDDDNKMSKLKDDEIAMKLNLNRAVSVHFVLRHRRKVIPLNLNQSQFLSYISRTKAYLSSSNLGWRIRFIPFSWF